MGLPHFKPNVLTCGFNWASASWSSGLLVDVITSVAWDSSLMQEKPNALLFKEEVEHNSTLSLVTWMLNGEMSSYCPLFASTTDDRHWFAESQGCWGSLLLHAFANKLSIMTVPLMYYMNWIFDVKMVLWYIDTTSQTHEPTWVPSVTRWPAAWLPWLVTPSSYSYSCTQKPLNLTRFIITQLIMLFAAASLSTTPTSCVCAEFMLRSNVHACIC